MIVQRQESVLFVKPLLLVNRYLNQENIARLFPVATALVLSTIFILGGAAASKLAPPKLSDTSWPAGANRIVATGAPRLILSYG